MDVRWVLVSALRRTEERALHYWCPLTVAKCHGTCVKGRLGVLEWALFRSGEVSHREVPGNDAQCCCHFAFQVHVSPPNERISLMSQ